MGKMQKRSLKIKADHVPLRARVTAARHLILNGTFELSMKFEDEAVE